MENRHNKDACLLVPCKAQTFLTGFTFCSAELAALGMTVSQEKAASKRAAVLLPALADTVCDCRLHCFQVLLCRRDPWRGTDLAKMAGLFLSVRAFSNTHSCACARQSFSSMPAQGAQGAVDP